MGVGWLYVRYNRNDDDTVHMYSVFARQRVLYSMQYMYIIWIIRNIIHIAYTYIFVGCADPRRENAARAAYEALETQSDGVCRCKDGRGRRWRKNVPRGRREG